MLLLISKKKKKKNKQTNTPTVYPTLVDLNAYEEKPLEELAPAHTGLFGNGNCFSFFG
jgi:hypothetical protein